MVARSVVVTIPEGLHARPAALFARAAAGLGVPVTVRRDGRSPAPAASLLAVMALGVRAGDEVTLEADGPGAEVALEALARVLRGEVDGVVAGAGAAPGEPAPDGTTAPLVVRAPLAGTVVALADVPDPVLAAAMVGPGVAIDPVGDGEVAAVAPIDGTLTKLHPHAFVVTAPYGRAVLVHLGLDTVELHGAGFTLQAAEGDVVRAGDVVVTWDPGAVAAGGRSVLCPVVALEAAAKAVSPADLAALVAAGDPLLTWR